MLNIEQFTQRDQNAYLVRISSNFLETSLAVRSKSSAMLFCLAGSIELNCSQRSPSMTFCKQVRKKLENLNQVSVAIQII